MKRFKYDAISKQYILIQLKMAELTGYWMCLVRHGSWRDGVQYVIHNGDDPMPIREAMENEILRWFEPEYSDEVMNDIMENKF